MLSHADFSLADYDTHRNGLELPENRYRRFLSAEETNHILHRGDRAHYVSHITLVVCDPINRIASDEVCPYKRLTFLSKGLVILIPGTLAAYPAAILVDT